MLKNMSNKNNVIAGLQKEVARLQSELFDALQAEKSGRDNIDAEMQAVALLRERAHEAEKAAAEAQRDMLARPHRATVERCQEARRESDRMRVEKQLEYNEIRRVLTERVRKLRTKNEWLSLYAVLSIIAFAYLVLA